MEDLLKDVAFIIERDNLKEKNRQRHKVHKRMYLYNVLHSYEYSLVRIASLFDKNHATIIHSITQYKNLRDCEDEMMLKDIAIYQRFFNIRKRFYALEKRKAIELIDSNDYMISTIKRYTNVLIKNLNLLNEKHKNLEI